MQVVAALCDLDRIGLLSVLGRDGPVLAVGRDLRAVSAIQQRFIDAQQAMERDYWRQRQAEARYRMLFQVATDGVLVVDAEDRLRFRPVTLLRADRDTVLVSAGLQAGERVCISPLQLVVDGMRVAPVADDAGAES